MKLSRRELHTLVVFVEEKIDTFVQLNTGASIKSAKQLSHLRSKLNTELKRCPTDR